MREISIFESVVKDSFIDKIESAAWCTDLMQYAAYKCKIDGLIASAHLFCPEIIQIKDYIFIKQFWNCSVEESVEYIERLEEQYQSKKAIEMSVNTWSIGDFFIGDTSKLMDDDEIIIQFGNALVYFWKSRVRELFPEKKITVRLGNDLMGEYGLCLTLYEND